MIIDRLLAGGVKLWLRSQLTEIKNLKVTIKGKDRQIMTGYIPDIMIVAHAAKYQKISLSQVEIRGLNIRFNLNDVLRAKPFQLLEPVSVTTKILLQESDLQASLASPLLLSGLKDFWHNLLQKTDNTITKKFENSSITWQEFSLQSETLTLTGNIQDSNSRLQIITGLTLLNPQTLLFSPITILGIPELAAEKASTLTIDLGKDVTISKLALLKNQLLFVGTIKIFPDK